MNSNPNNKKQVPQPGEHEQSAAVSNYGDVDDASIVVTLSPVESPGRRSFLKQAGMLSTGLVSGPMLFQAGVGGAQAAEPAPADDLIQPSVESRPVLSFNDADPSHLLSIDLRSEAGLLALNDTYGAGTYTLVGNLVFDAHRGVQAYDDTSGLVIDLGNILAADVRLGLAEEGQLTVELESKRIADPWLLDTYTDRYQAIRRDVSRFPASLGLPPFPQKETLCGMMAEDGEGGPFIQGPQPESPDGLGTRANNLSVRLSDKSFQDMRIGIHTAVHGEFSAVTTTWWAPNSFTVYIDGVPQFLAGPSAVGSNGVQVEQAAYTMTDVPANSSPKRHLRLFFGRSGVYIRRIILGAQAPLFEVHPLFRTWASYGDSFTHRGGYANGRRPVADFWDTDRVYYFIRNLSRFGYRAGWCWNNSLGGGSFLRTANKSLWDNGGQWDLESLKSVDPSYVMMAASHNDAGYVGRGGSPETAEYQRRLSEVRQDFLEHIEVILTGQSQNWNKVSLPGDAKIGIISAPVSPRAPGWGENHAQAQRDLNAFVLREVPDWVRTNLGDTYANRIATFDVAALFGTQHLVDYHPQFETSGTGTHPNWWGADLLDYGWWQCALEHMNREATSGNSGKKRGKGGV